MVECLPKWPSYPTVTESTALSVVTATTHQDIKAIFTLTSSGGSMMHLAKYRPACPIVVISRDAQVCRQAHLYRGCFGTLHVVDSSHLPGKLAPFSPDISYRCWCAPRWLLSVPP